MRTRATIRAAAACALIALCGCLSKDEAGEPPYAAEPAGSKAAGPSGADEEAPAQDFQYRSGEAASGQGGEWAQRPEEPSPDPASMASPEPIVEKDVSRRRQRAQSQDKAPTRGAPTTGITVNGQAPGYNADNWDGAEDQNQPGDLAKGEFKVELLKQRPAVLKPSAQNELTIEPGGDTGAAEQMQELDRIDDVLLANKEMVRDETELVVDGRFRTLTQDAEKTGRLEEGKFGTKTGKDTGILSWTGEEVDARYHEAMEPEETRPMSFLPRKLYFENTYLGGDAAFQERARRLDEALAGQPLPHKRALGYLQPFDPPEDAGLALSVDVDRRYLEKKGRVILQVGLQGSQRYGWRRPPLDVVLVLDGPAVSEDPEMAFAVASELLAQLGPQDHLGVIVAGASPRVLAPLDRIRGLQGPLALAFDALGPVHASGDDALAAAMRSAGDMLADATEDRSTLPGTQTVLVVARGMDAGRVQPARQVAHQLTLKGMVTSVIETGGGEGLWWEVNDAGYGNYHQVAGRDPREAVRTELETLSRVVARLVRVNVRLAPGVEAVRILGSRVLDEAEVTQVKAREVAADQHISRTLGVTADRGDDDDGLQTVIPYFYGGDSHVILIELWVDRPGAIADVTLRYKDMVNLGNATSRASVAVRNLPREETREQLAVRRNTRGFQVGEALEHASLRLRRGDLSGARSWLVQARMAATRATASDREVVESFVQALDQGDLSWDTGRRALISQSLFVAARRKIGETASLEGR